MTKTLLSKVLLEAQPATSPSDAPPAAGAPPVPTPPAVPPSSATHSPPADPVDGAPARSPYEAAAAEVFSTVANLDIAARAAVPAPPASTPAAGAPVSTPPVPPPGWAAAAAAGMPVPAPPVPVPPVPPASAGAPVSRLTLEQVAGMSPERRVKEHPDPLAREALKDPVVTRLERARVLATAALAAVQARPGATPAELQAAQQQVQKIDVGLRNAATLAPKARGAEYATEFEQMGWRADLEQPPLEPRPGESLEALALRTQARDAYWADNREKFRTSNLQLTKKFTPEERARAELAVKPDGTVEGAPTRHEDGTVSGPAGPMTGEVEYVMDAAGTMLQFTQKPGGLEADYQALHPVTEKPVPKLIVTHHSSVLAGEAVAGAGEVEFAAGKITKISNRSGHYKPSIAHLLQTVEVLARQGALLDKDLWMLNPATGRGEPLGGSALEAHNQIPILQARLAPQTERLKALKGIVDGKRPGAADATAEVAEMERLEAAMAGPVAALAAAQAVVRDWGVGPRNKFRDVAVEALGGKDSDSGAAFVEGGRTPATAEEFLTSGGSAAQKAAKGLVHRELAATKEATVGARAEKTETRKVEFQQSLGNLAGALGQNQTALTQLTAEIARLDAATAGPSGKVADLAKLKAARKVLPVLQAWIGQVKPFLKSASAGADPREETVARHLEADGESLQTELAKVGIAGAPPATPPSAPPSPPSGAAAAAAGVTPSAVPLPPASARSATAPPAAPPPAAGGSPAPAAPPKPALSPEEVQRIAALDSAIQTMNRDSLTAALTAFGIDAVLSKAVTDGWAFIEDPAQRHPNRVQRMSKVVQAINGVENKRVKDSLLKLQRTLVQRYL